ncbi:MAG TPA: STAS domain-containing protein [Candidatus Dormibacteraeota bacterium]|nr:STAS domain-containing protein [Candidatus Dormibacteraeota bacterium]
MGITSFRLDCGGMREPDLSVIDQIARLELSCRRCGCELRLANANGDLAELIELVGLAGILRLETGRQPEERKEPRRVEEEGQLADPSV